MEASIDKLIIRGIISARRHFDSVMNLKVPIHIRHKISLVIKIMNNTCINELLLCYELNKTTRIISPSPISIKKAFAKSFVTTPVSAWATTLLILKLSPIYSDLHLQQTESRCQVSSPCSIHHKLQ
jgi:hypothetical protein